MQRILSLGVLYYLRFLAKIALFINRPQVIGITGSAGKSSTRNSVLAVLKNDFKTKMIEKGNSESGIPLGVLGLAPRDYSRVDWLRMILLAPLGLFHLLGTKYLIVEMGIDEPDAPKNMSYLLTIVKPQISIFINVHPVHTMQFEKSISNVLSQKRLTDSEKIELILRKIAEEKGKIFTNNPNCQYAIYNKDDSHVLSVVKKIQNKYINLLSFGEGAENTLRYMDYSVGVSGTNFTFYSNNTKTPYEIRIDKYLLPKVYAQGLASAILVGEVLEIDKIKIKQGLENELRIPKSRSSLFRGINNSIIIDSSYNSSKAPSLAFLELAEELKKKEKKDVVFVMGDMRELGERDRSEHEEVGRRLFEIVDYLYCVGPLTKKFIIQNPKFKIQRAKLKEAKWFSNSVEAGKYLKNKLPINSLVLVKGSQNTIFLEEAIKFILKNERDAEKLCRQDDYWMRQKAYLYQS